MPFLTSPLAQLALEPMTLGKRFNHEIIAVYLVPLLTFFVATDPTFFFQYL